MKKNVFRNKRRLKKKVFKIFMYDITNGYKSVCNNSMAVQYKYKRKTVSKIGYLFAFESLDKALLFLKQIHGFFGRKPCSWVKVCECDAELADINIPKKIPSFPPKYTQSEIEMCKSFWNGSEDYFDELELIGTPLGTVLCKSIKITKDITDTIKEI